MSNQKDDVEAGTNLLYPLMQESPELRWAFIRKVYSILTIQLLATIGFATVVVTVHPIANFFNNTRIGLATYVVIILFPLIVLCLLYIYQHKHPLNFILLGIYTLFFGLVFGVLCAFTSDFATGKAVIEAVIATTMVVICLTAYTFWAARRGQDFGFLVPFLLSILVILLIFTIFQIFFPMGKISEIIYSGFCAIIFCAYIIYDTDTLIKRNSYDEYIWASVSLYLDVLNLFLRLLEIFQAVNR